MTKTTDKQKTLLDSMTKKTDKQKRLHIVRQYDFQLLLFRSALEDNWNIQQKRNKKVLKGGDKGKR